MVTRMGTLKTFLNYLDGRHKVLADTEQRLCKLQEKYETFFCEVSRVRESEFGQLRDHILADRSRLPGEIDRKLDQAAYSEQEAFDKKLAALKEEHDELVQEAVHLRRESAEDERRLRQANLDLDAAEEVLKSRSAELLDAIGRYNRRIQEMGRGFGFFRNLFRMRRLQAERRDLDREQADVAARIDALRTRWQVADEEFAQKEVRRKAEWLELTTEAGAVQTKIEYLRAASRSIVQRSALERVLFERLPDLAEPRQGDPACPRCEQPNPSTSHFCRICARRLVDDRPGLLGSLDEIAEVNLHHQRFSEGMQASQEIIGLVRGLKTGIESFTESVADMRTSQTKHNLKTLQIDVPQDSIEYGKHFDRLLQKVRDGGLSLHPKVFAGHIQGLIAEVYTEDRIKEFFETMGEELSTQADAQW